MKFKNLTVAMIAALFGLSEAQADVLCISKAGKSRVASACNAKETTFQGSGPQGPAGPAGASGINNAPCTQGDIAGSVWEVVLFDPIYNQVDNCAIFFDNNGNLLPNSACNQIIGTNTTSINLTQGSMKLAAPENLCGYQLRLTKSTGATWAAFAFVDRTRSNLQGIGGVSIGANQLRSGATITGTRLGAVNSLNPQTAALIEQAHESLRKALSAE